VAQSTVVLTAVARAVIVFMAIHNFRPAVPGFVGTAFDQPPPPYADCVAVAQVNVVLPTGHTGSTVDQRYR
jgi:hypothetical protein